MLYPIQQLLKHLAVSHPVVAEILYQMSHHLLKAGMLVVSAGMPSNESTKEAGHSDGCDHLFHTVCSAQQRRMESHAG